MTRKNLCGVCLQKRTGVRYRDNIRGTACRECYDEWTVISARRPVEDPINVNNVKECPHCGTMIEKVGGCNQVVCNCGCTFDWQTMQPKLSDGLLMLVVGGVAITLLLSVIIVRVYYTPDNPFDRSALPKVDNLVDLLGDTIKRSKNLLEKDRIPEQLQLTLQNLVKNNEGYIKQLRKVKQEFI